MRALRIHEYGGALQIEETQPPVAGPGQVIVRNQATSLNPVDPLRASGIMRQVFPIQFPWTPGGDVTGIIESIGEGVTAFQPGDAVFGYSITGGAYAELVAINAAALAMRPQVLTAETAAAVGVVSQTAIQSLQLAQVVLARPY